MDLNDDGYEDIISGSYSVRENLGFFQVLWGSEKGFKAAETLNGSDGKPLLNHREERGDNDQMDSELYCTRVFSSDLNGDGHLDLIAGSSSGSFHFFEGEGEGKFKPQATKLKAGESRLSVSGKSDPCLFDWDRDGDLDLISGAATGGVNFAENTGSKTDPKFAPFVSWVEPVGYNYGKGKLGDGHITAPCGTTRVCVEDVNGDGLFDLLVGDNVRLRFAAKGVKESDVKKLLDDWKSKYDQLITSTDHERKREELEQKAFALMDKLGAVKDLKRNNDLLTELKAIGRELEALANKDIGQMDQRKKIVREYYTGYVWVYYQLPRQD